MNRIHGVLAIVAIFVVVVDGRVYYLQNSDANRYAGLTYPIPSEQSSRDLDLSFSAGDPNDIDDGVQPANKVYTMVAAPPAAKPFVEVNKEELPNVRYKLVEAPVKRFAGPDDVILLPEQNSRKTVKIDGNNKGEVILELRVIANHDSA